MVDESAAAVEIMQRRLKNYSPRLVEELPSGSVKD
jgi:hypothetical protein